MNPSVRKLQLILILASITINVFGQERPKIGLALSGGGAGGLAHIGALKVIEKAGIPIDYIAGSSMGSIIGALYSIGYSPEEMELLVGQKDWESIMSDQIPRADLSYEAKKLLEKYFYSFPISSSGIQLPTGLVDGHLITNMLAGLTLPAYKIRDFDDLPIPYRCVSVDIENGEEIIMDHGVLHDAIRASMAIPTYFTPVEVQGRLLVDGGFVNNFPANVLQEMGAEYIIGLDVQRELFSKEDLNNMGNLMKQASALTREDVNKKNRELCDILIRPRSPGASTLSFGRAKEIIKDGERIAMEHWETLEALGKNLAAMDSGYKKQKLERIDSVFVSELRYTGMDKISEDYLWSKIDLPFPAWLSANQINEGLQRAYGTNFFKKITYQIDSIMGGNRLLIRAVEKYDDQAHVGLHFDNLFNASLLLRANFRNLWKTGDLVDIDLNLGENMHVGASYYFLTHKRQNFGINTEYNRLVAYQYIEGRRSSENTYHDLILDLATNTTFNNVFALSTGLQAEFASIAPKINIFELGTFTSRILNFYTSLNKDSFNKTSFPTRGEKVDILAKLITNFEEGEIYPAFIFSYRHNLALEFNKRLSIHLGISTGLALGDSIPYPYRSYMGGLGYYHKSLFPFIGMSYMERAADHSLIGKADFQFNVKGNHYVSWRNNVGQSFNNMNELRNFSEILVGTGITYGYSTPFGPIEGTIMVSNNSWKPLLFINIGYWIK